MSPQIGHLRLVEPPEASNPSRPAATPAPAFAAPRVTADIADFIPAAPPPDLLDEVFAAGERAADMASANRELHFEKDPASGRIVVQVRDLDGNVLRTVPPSEALDIMAGAKEI